MFYPQHPTELQQQLMGYIYQIKTTDTEYKNQQPKVLIVPHAGTIYSGPTAAHAYALLAPWKSQISRVVLIGPSHHHPFQGLALPAEEMFETPLGCISIDQTLASQLPKQDVAVIDAAHRHEHSLEVQLPFLQLVLDSFSILPLVVGDASPDQVCRVLTQVWGGPETLILISTDLSHFHSYSEAQKIDAQTNQRILDFNFELRGDQACGCRGLNGLLKLAAHKSMKIELLNLCNSGDTAGSKDRVVGYAAYALH